MNLSSTIPQPLGWWRQFLYVLTVGFIFFFFSERMFWTVFAEKATPEEESGAIMELVITWLAYSAVAYLFLTVCFVLRVSGFASVYIAGAVFGWLLEGGIAPTLYGTEASAPLPLSIFWTAIAWHATLTVWLGWHRLGTALRDGRKGEIVALSLFFGVFWGMWAMFPWQETPPLKTSADAFLIHIVIMTFVVVLAYLLNHRLLRQRHFKPAPLGMLIALTVWSLFWFQYLVAIGWIVPVVLGTVLLIAFVPLWRTRQRRTVDTVVAAHGLKTAWLGYLILFISLPLFATTTYVICVNTGMTEFSVAPVLLWGSTAIGIVLFFVAYTQVWMHKAALADGLVPAATEATAVAD